MGTRQSFDIKITLNCGHSIQGRTLTLDTLPTIGAPLGCLTCHCDMAIEDIHWTTDNGGGVVIAAGHVSN